MTSEREVRIRDRGSIRRLVAVFLIGAFAGAASWWAASRAWRPHGAGVEDPPGTPASDSGAGGLVRLPPAAMRNAGLTVVRAEIRSLPRTIQATGVVGPDESRVAHMRPLARGRVERVFVRTGDRVEAGQALAEYDNIEMGDAIGQYLSALAAIEQAQAEAEVAKRALERAADLVQRGALAKAAHERRDAEYKNALAAMRSHQAEAARIEEKLHRFGLAEPEIEALRPATGGGYHREASHTTLRAPFPGIVIRARVAEGETVDPADELFTIADLSTVWVQADVYEMDLPAVRPGQQVKVVSVSYPDRPFPGKVSYVSDVLDPKTRTARVRCEILNPGGLLKLEMFVTVELATRAARPALVIPSPSVQQIGGSPAVFVQTGESEFQLRTPRLGAAGDGWVEVLEGIRNGESIATEGSFYLKSRLLRARIGVED